MEISYPLFTPRPTQRPHYQGRSDFVSENNQSDFQHITKTTSFLKDIKQFETVNKIYGSYFKNSLPARSTVEVSS
ncbi:hypothetical protein G6053_17350 [Sphingobacterium sp. DR205]|nr:hypothetical protein G6053_17350 [Sphingobacterium sp. DR205]